MTKFYRTKYKPIADAGPNETNAIYSAWGTSPFNFINVPKGHYNVGYEVWDDQDVLVVDPVVMPTVLVGAPSSSVTATPVSPALPVGYAVDDYLFVVGNWRQNQVSPSDPLWTLLGETAGTSSSQNDIGMWYRKATSLSEVPMNFATAAGQKSAVCFAVRGAEAPVLVGSGFNNTASVDVIMTGGPVPVANSLIFPAFATNQTNGLGDLMVGVMSNPDLTNMTSRVRYTPTGSGSIQGLYINTAECLTAKTIADTLATLSQAFGKANMTAAFRPKIAV